MSIELPVEHQPQPKPTHTWLVVFLALAGISVLVANQHSPEMSGHVLAIFSFVFPAAMVIFSVKMTLGAKSRYDAAIVWFLAAFYTMWFVAEQIWDINEEIFHEYFSTSIADLFWTIGYAMLFAFLMLIIKPLRKHVTKKIVFLSIILSLSFLIPSLIILIEINESVATGFTVDVLYTILDSIVLVPTVCLFAVFKNLKENYMWTILFAIIITVATDTGYLLLELKDMYYLGHPIWIGYEWAFILFAYGTYRQLNIIKKSEGPFMKYLEGELGKKETKSEVIILTPIIIASAILIFVFSTVVIFEFEELSTQQIRFFQPIVYGVISAIVSITALILIINKKTSSLKTRIEESSELVKKITEMRDLDKKTREMSGQILILERRVNQMEKTRGISTKSLIGVSVILLAVIGYYLYTNYVIPPEHFVGTKTKFVVENLKGDIIDTWVSWRLADNEPLHISIINSDLLAPDKINVVKNAILSEETVQIQNSELGKEPPDLVETYYVGWKGALEEASKQQTTIVIPTNLQVELSDRPVGDIVIILSNLKESDGTLGFTRSIADENANQILKSVITIFDVENLDDHELSGVIRHELGHALGLGHSTASEDLMYATFRSHSAYISSCDIDAVVSLYDEQGNPAVICEN